MKSHINQKSYATKSRTDEMTRQNVVHPVDPWETFFLHRLAYWDVGVITVLEFGDKLIPQGLDVCGSKV